VMLYLVFGTISMQLWLFLGLLLMACVIYLLMRRRKKENNKINHDHPINHRTKQEQKPERQRNGLWKIIAVLVAICIVIAGWFVVSYMLPNETTTTFTDEYRWVYQEAPNLTTFMGNGVDGNWSTWEPLTNETDPSYYFCNYAMRTTAVGTVWEVKDAYGRTNYTIPAEAMSEPIVKVQGFFNQTTSTITYQLYYGSVWHELAERTPATNEFYEEAIHWKFLV